MGTFQILLTALLFFPVLRATPLQPSPFVHNGEPTNITVMEGSFASFSCLLTHMLPYSIDWMFNLSYVTTNGSLQVVDISKHNISTVGPTKGETLFVKNIAKTDEGFYRCVVSVNGRSISNSTDGYLKVILKPTLRHVPSNQTVVEGDNVTFHCQLENFDPQYFFVSWFWNEINISRNYDIYEEPNFTDEYNIQGNRSLGLEFDLQVWRISRNSTGHFDCRVYFTDNHRFILHPYYAYVDVLFPPESKYPDCESSSLKEYYREGEMINTTCAVKGGKGPVILRWTVGPNRSMEDGTLLVEKESTNVSIQKSWTLTAEDDDSYIVCSMRGDAILKEEECSIGPLNVHYGPIVTILTNVSTSKTGDNATFKCSIKSNPMINATDYVWFVNGTMASKSSRYTIAEHKDMSALTMYNVTEIEDNSIITCQAGITGYSNVSTVLRVSATSASVETLTSLPWFTVLSKTTSTGESVGTLTSQPRFIFLSETTDVKNFEGDAVHLNGTIHIYIHIGSVLVFIIAMIVTIACFVRHLHNREKRLAQPFNELDCADERPHYHELNHVDIQVHYEHLRSDSKDVISGTTSESELELRWYDSSATLSDTRSSAKVTHPDVDNVTPDDIKVIYDVVH